MATRVVEGKKPYTGGKAISIDENKVISLNLRDENNLIIYDAGDDEIYVDLQLDDEITPTSAFPIGVNVGRVIVDNGWDKAGTIISAETTSGDNIKIFYADEGTLWIDNGTGTFKQIYFKADVDALLLALRNYIDGELAKKQNGVSSDTAPSNPSEGDLWYDTTNSAMKVWDGTAWQSVGTGGGGSDIVYATQAEYNALLPGALTDNKHYFIYTESGGGGWQPGVNTMAYWKFDGNLTDETGNMTATGSGIQYGTVGTKHYVENTATDTSCVITVNGNGLSQIGSGDFCVSFWGYIPSGLSSRIPNFFGEWYNGVTPRPGLVIRALGNDGGKIERYTDGYTTASTTSTYLGQWTYITFTRLSGVCYCYINSTQITTINNSTDLSSGTDHVFYLMGRLGFNDGTRPVTGVRMSELIYEKQGWSSQDVSDYFNDTKADYGIS